MATARGGQAGRSVKRTLPTRPSLAPNASGEIAPISRGASTSSPSGLGPAARRGIDPRSRDGCPRGRAGRCRPSPPPRGRRGPALRGHSGLAVASLREYAEPTPSSTRRVAENARSTTPKISSRACFQRGTALASLARRGEQPTRHRASQGLALAADPAAPANPAPLTRRYTEVRGA
jgi:hypothetical protein